MKWLKRSAILIGVAALVLLGAAGAFYAKLRMETREMKPLATGEVADGVFAVRDGYVNLYLIRGDGGFIAIDAGDKAERVQEELARLKIAPKQVQAVFLTHTDRDHIAALKLFSAAKVYLAKEEEQMINGRTARFFSLIHNSLPAGYETITDGQIIAVAGVKVRGVLTPGHTPGAMCYLVQDRDLFVGDSMSLKDGKSGLFNEFFNMDSPTQRKSLGLMKGLAAVQTVYTAHYGATDRPREAFANW